MKYIFPTFFVFSFLLIVACSTSNEKKENTADPDKTFLQFEDVFLDAYWKHYPTGSVYIGYGKYYDQLVIPDSLSFAQDLSFSKAWLDSLKAIDYKNLSENNKISFNIIKNQLESDIWYNSVFKPQEWDASIYNISSASYYIINQPYAPLDERLKILSRYLQHSDDYYKAAFNNLHRPTKEHLELAILQNKGGLEIFGKALTDSIKASQLSKAEKDALNQNIEKTVNSIKGFIASLEKIIADKEYILRDFRIGKKLFAEKFKYDIVTDLTPEQVYEKAKKDKHIYHKKMFLIADSLWNRYHGKLPKPKDSLKLIQMVLDKMQDNHAKPADFYKVVKNQVQELKKFILEKDLFDFDTSATPIIVRYMPSHQRGVTLASAEFIPPYQKKGATYYNVDDLTLYPPEKAESALRECNDYASQILSIHEAVPGHCMQGIYNQKKSPDIVRAVFQNGAMIEGWAVYTEEMMVENGWGNHSPEIEMALYIWKLRQLGNVVIDYDIQCLNKSKEEIVRFLSVECFQTAQQVEEKYHRATLSQVQLCSYYSGATAILALREDYKKKMGDKYSLKTFHEAFLSYGSSPVKFIRERMLQ